MPRDLTRADVDRQGGRFRIKAQLLPASTAVVSGRWIRVFQAHPFSVVIPGAFTGQAKILVANGPESPSGADAEYPQLGATAVDAPRAYVSDGPYEWVKAVVTVLTAGTVGPVELVGTSVVGERG